MIVLTAYALQRKKFVLRLYWATAPCDRFSVSVQFFSAVMGNQLKRFCFTISKFVFWIMYLGEFMFTDPLLEIGSTVTLLPGGSSKLNKDYYGNEMVF